MHKHTASSLPVGVLGASGYAGRELCALVARHPTMELVFAAANEQHGERLRLAGVETAFVAAGDAPLDRTALIFSAMPHGASAPWVERACHAGAKVVDLSADFRPGNGSRSVPYGLTEARRREIRDASLVANPGCYATAILLALLPLLLRELVAPGGTIIVNAASGVTGAGFTPRRDLLFAEVAEDFRPYAPGNTHRHLREMRALMAEFCGGDVPDLIFTPHLLPVSRGILATITVPLVHPLADPLQPWREQYAGEPFVEVTAEVPALRDVVHRNVIRISAVPAEQVRQPTLVVYAALDNLLKGAAGQAMQNANLLLGLDETAGLPA
ncbi:MAG TPA: N-acetyl-gamma-glutamyl-phosphate reductase [Gemmatimonadaceae bacterium]|nr:N-acetyl-gamma-glutamyl-phosphate reductase [Gemmatimonadaceae bacterium]